MIVRFCLYSVLKNLRFADPFLAIYLIELGFSYTEIGAMLGFEKLVTALLEIPSGFGADRWGRRSILACSFACHALGLSILAVGAGFDTPSPLWFYAGLGIFGVGEAFRTGSHKAIMLDYLELNGRREETTAVLSLARTFSKLSSASAGLLAGGLLYLLHDYGMLFWLSAAAAVGGCVLILSYPKYLEGECHRRRAESTKSFDAQEYTLASMMRNAKMWPLMLQSVLYESQVEVILKLFLQPFLYQGLTKAGISLVAAGGAGTSHATGSLVVGVNELFRDGLGAMGANRSAQLERMLASRLVGLKIIYLFTIAVLGLLAIGAVSPARFLWWGLAAIGVLTLLQNLRRPIYVSQLNIVANKPLRATILSIDNQASSFLVALQMPLMGLAADTWGLWAVAATSVALLIGGAVYFRRN